EVQRQDGIATQRLDLDGILGRQRGAIFRKQRKGFLVFGWEGGGCPSISRRRGGLQLSRGDEVVVRHEDLQAGTAAHHPVRGLQLVDARPERRVAMWALCNEERHQGPVHTRRMRRCGCSDQRLIPSILTHSSRVTGASISKYGS